MAEQRNGLLLFLFAPARSGGNAEKEESGGRVVSTANLFLALCLVNLTGKTPTYLPWKALFADSCTQ